MADNSTLPAAGTVVATDDVGGIHYQRVKLDVGGDGATVPVVGAVPIGGEVAHGIGDSGNPVKMGGKASSTTPVAVATGSRVDAWADVYGRQVIADLDPELNLGTGITTYRERVVAPRYTVQADSIVDGLASFWTQTVANGGTIGVVAGEGQIASGTAANGSAQLVSTAPAYLPGQSAWLLSSARFGDTGSAGNTRRLGAFTVSGTTPQNGYYFELADTVLNIGYAKAGVATVVASTAWSRVAVAPFTMDANYHLFEIRWTANRADFYIDNILRHTTSVTNSPLTATLNFPKAIQSISTSGSTSRVMVVRNIGLGRFGMPDQQAVTMQYRADANGAASIKHVVAAAGTNAVNVKASPGRVLGWALLNTANALRFVKLHNTAGTPTAGAGVVQTIAMPANGLAQFRLEGGVAYTAGIGLTTTAGTGADADTNAVAAGDIVGDIFFQ